MMQVKTTDLMSSEEKGEIVGIYRCIYIFIVFQLLRQSARVGMINKTTSSRVKSYADQQEFCSGQNPTACLQNLCGL